MSHLKVTAARRAGWEVAFADLMAEKQSHVFAYGEDDCATLHADVCRALTGIDPMNGLRGAYVSKTAAARLMKKRGFASHEAALDAHFERCAPAMARRGDIGLVETESGLGGVVVMGAMVWGWAEPKAGAGGRFVDRAQLVRAWRVG